MSAAQESVPVSLPSQEAEVSQLQLLAALLWRRKGLLTFGLVAGLILGGIYYARSEPVYQSKAQLLVVKKRPELLPGAGLDNRYLTMSLADDYLTTHIVIMRSPLIVSRALQRRGLTQLPSLRNHPDPAGFLSNGLRVTRDTKETGGSASNILYLSFEGPFPEDCATILKAVVESYREFLDEAYRSMSNETLELINQAKNYLRKDLKDKEQAYREFREKAPVLLRGKHGGIASQERITALESRQAALLVRRTEVQGRLAALEAAIASGASPAALRAFVADLARRNTTNGRTEPFARNPSRSVEEQLLPLLLQEQALLQNYGPEHPQVISVRQRIEYTRRFFQELWDLDPPNPGEERGGEKAEAAQTRTSDPVQRVRASLLQELKEIEAEEKEIAQALRTEQEQAKALLLLELEEESLRGDLARTQQLYENIIKRLQEIDLGKEGGGFEAQLISPPGPGVQIAPKAVSIFGGAGVVGLLLGMGLAYLAELLDKSFRSADEIRARLHLPLLGHVPVLPSLPPGSVQGDLDGSLIAYHRPRSLEAEVFRSIRTGLYFSTLGQRHQIIQITSSVKGEGKSTVAANLAVSIAQSGRTAILVDADLRHPRVHHLFYLANDQGLADVVRGRVHWKEAVQATACPNLTALTSGRPPANPAELLTQPRLQELIDALRQEFDYVIFDTPPLLAVTDPCVVAPRVDGVILVLRLTKNNRPLAERSRNLLQSLGANILGVVVNGVTRRSRTTYGYIQEGYLYGSDYLAIGQEWREGADAFEAYYQTGEPAQSETEADGRLANSAASRPGIGDPSQRPAGPDQEP